ncbi:MAG: hypothetical protein QXR53_02725 [Candidatus Norongarragalinales archaeon]
MNEKLLVLAKAYPVTSSKYKHLVCIAGITDAGELRRIYPVSWEHFWNNGFKKKSWIEYEIIGKKPEDKRIESMKIKEDTIACLQEESWTKIKQLLQPHMTTYSELAKKVKDTDVSIGIVKPKLIDFVREKRSENVLEKIKKGKEQTTLDSDFEKGS